MILSLIAVTALTQHEGIITSMGTWKSGTDWVVIEGKVKGLNSRPNDLEKGDWVKLLCTTRCWVAEIRKDLTRQ